MLKQRPVDLDCHNLKIYNAKVVVKSEQKNIRD